MKVPQWFTPETYRYPILGVLACLPLASISYLNSGWMGVATTLGGMLLGHLLARGMFLYYKKRGARNSKVTRTENRGDY